MQIGMIGLGRMGANMVRRLLRGGHECVVFDLSSKAVEELVQGKAVGATDFKDLVQKLSKPRAIWMMVPAGQTDRRWDAPNDERPLKSWVESELFTTSSSPNHRSGTDRIVQMDSVYGWLDSTEPRL